MFNTDTPVEECCGIVVDPDHENFGMVGDITFHDWQEYGKVGVRFGDNTYDELDDGLMKDECRPPQVFIMKKVDREKISEIQKRLADVREPLAMHNLVARSVHEKKETCLAAKKAFWEIVRSITFPDLGY